MIKAELITHRDQERIKLGFGFDEVIKAKVRSIEGAVWSQTNKAWLMPNNAEIREQLKLMFPELVLPVVQKNEQGKEGMVTVNSKVIFYLNKTTILCEIQFVY